MPDSVKEFTENFMRKPIEILVKDIELTLGGNVYIIMVGYSIISQTKVYYMILNDTGLYLYTV